MYGRSLSSFESKPSAVHLTFLIVGLFGNVVLWMICGPPIAGGARRIS